ncbi:hypothetical protein RISK_003769 [Rhodopirellula islandica]|uniref:Uncharacterized protein n=1 Tax=Rhodopirellula islandica TaxID=595434 RepID=A0A0J1BCA7_RHOIS|nr:hypothetical protein RISK_003769 [Rhodopirellula islandica]
MSNPGISISSEIIPIRLVPETLAPGTANFFTNRIATMEMITQLID